MGVSLPVQGRGTGSNPTNRFETLHVEPDFDHGIPPEERLMGSATLAALAIANGADMIRVHDVRTMAQVARVTDAVVRG